jgi:hypothetical protein
MKVENPVRVEPEFRQSVVDGVVTFEILGGLSPSDDIFMVGGKFSDKLAMSYEGPWPCGDFMPVKNSKVKDPRFANTGMESAPTCAFMIRGDLSAIYADDGKTVLFQYKDIDDLLAAGWRVD